MKISDICNHTIMISNAYGVGKEIKIIGLKTWDKSGYNVTKQQLIDQSSGLSRKFNYCPDCGAKIDWKKIKEEL